MSIFHAPLYRQNTPGQGDQRRETFALTSGMQRHAPPNSGSSLGLLVVMSGSVQSIELLQPGVEDVYSTIDQRWVLEAHIHEALEQRVRWRVIAVH